MSRSKSDGGLLKALALILLVVIVIGMISKLTNGFTSSAKSFAVRRNGEMIYNDVSGLTMSGTEVYELVPGGNEYDVKIYAYGTNETDFLFKKGNEDGYSWQSNVVNANGGTDFTEYFEIEKSDGMFTVRYPAFEKLLDKWSPSLKITLPDEVPPGDRFVMVITSGNSSISLKFMTDYEVKSVGLNRGSIIF